MKIEICLYPSQDWDNFVSKYSDLIFHYSIWGKVISKAFNSNLLYFCLKNNSGEILLGMPSIVLDFKIVRILYAFIPYGGIIGEKEYIQDFFNLLENLVKENHVDQIRIVESPTTKYGDLDGYTKLTIPQHIIPIGRLNSEDLWNGYLPSVRKAIRRARKFGVEISPIKGREEIPEFYNLYLAMVKRNNTFAKYPVSLTFAIYDYLITSNQANILFAEYEGKKIAGICLIYSKKYVHEFQHGSLANYFNMRPNDLLIHQVIEDAILKGKDYFDFGSSPPGALSLMRFKEKWGAERFELNTYDKKLNLFSCFIWEKALKLANTKIGAGLINLARKMNYSKTFKF